MPSAGQVSNFSLRLGRAESGSRGRPNHFDKGTTYSRALEIISKQLEALNRKAGRGGLPKVNLVVRNSVLSSRDEGSVAKRLEGLRWMLDPNSPVSLEQRRGTFVRVLKGSSEIKDFFGEFDAVIDSVRSIIRQPNYKLQKTIFSGRVLASSMIGSMLGGAFYYSGNPSWVVFAGLVLAQSPPSVFVPFFKYRKKFERLSRVRSDGENSLLKAIEDDPWHMKNWALFSFNDKVSRQVVLSLLANPSFSGNPVARRSMQVADLAEHSGPFVRTVAELKDRWNAPAFRVAGDAVQVNPNIFLGYSKIYSDFFLTNNPETHEPVLIFVTRIHLRPPLFPRTSTSPADVPVDVFITRPAFAR